MLPVRNQQWCFLSPAPDKSPENHCPDLAALGMLWGPQMFQADIPVVLLQRCCMGPAASTQLSLLTNLWKSDFPSYFLLPSLTQAGLTLAVDARLAGGPWPGEAVKATFSLGIGLRPLSLCAGRMLCG